MTTAVPQPPLPIDWRGLISAGRASLTLQPPATQPNQEAARRAVSTAYYAAFHALTASNADTLVGTPTDQLTTDAWLRVYRRLDHGNAREQLRQNRQNFSARAATFTDLFLDLQNERHNADYNPTAIFTPQTATTWLNNTKAAIIDFFQTTTKRAAIAVLTLGAVYIQKTGIHQQVQFPKPHNGH